MGYKRRRRRNIETEIGECEIGWCAHGGRCVWSEQPGGARAACVCAGPWGGSRCRVYVGHDNACVHLQCVPPSVCSWNSPESSTEAGSPFCTCLEGARCVSSPPAAAPREPPAAAWPAALGAALLLLAAVLGALYAIHRRRMDSFDHTRLSDNVEINNPMYLAGEDESDPPLNHTHSNGGNHFANPVYESMYAPQQNNPTEEHDNLLPGSADGSPAPAEHAALL